MGIDLILLPFKACMNFPSSHDVLFLQRRDELNKLIDDIVEEHGRKLTEEFYSHCSLDEEGELHYGITKKDRHGSPLKYIAVGILLPLKDHPDVLNSQKNRAIWKFLSEIPDYHVALFWI